MKKFSLSFPGVLLRGIVIFLLFSSLTLLRAEARQLRQVTPESENFVSEYFTEFDGWIMELIERGNIPGAIVAVGRGDRIVYLKKWGDRQKNPVVEPLTYDTLYDLASCGKIVGLAPSIAMLVDQGKLQYEDPVVKYLPELNNHGKEKIKIRDLLTHTSGIRDGYSWSGTPEDIWQRIAQLPVKWEPGERYEYSCLGCVILGKVVERISGESYADWTRNHLYLPLGMTDTMFHPDAERRRRTAATQFMDGRWIKGEANDTRARRMGGGTGNGANFSTIHDTAVFASVMLNQGIYVTEDGREEKLFSPEIWEQMLSSQPTTIGNRALGWDKRADKPNRGVLQSSKACGHGGYTGTSIWIDPAFNTFVIMLSTRLNIDPKMPNIYPTAGKIANRVIDAIRDPRNETEIRTKVQNQVREFQAAEALAFLKGKKLCLIANNAEEVERFLNAGLEILKIFWRDEDHSAQLSTKIPQSLQLSKLNNRRIRVQDIKGSDTLVYVAEINGNGNSLSIRDLGSSLQSAADLDLEYVVMDTLNPQGMKLVEGEFPEAGTESSIIFRRLPQKFGMSPGELALLFNTEYQVNAKLTVIPCRETEITVPGTLESPVVTPTLSMKDDDTWFRYQRNLYLIYPR